MPRVGRVAALWRYPVKAMAAERLDAVDVSWHGLAGDRRWAFLRDEMAGSGFPWLTIRERHDLGRYRPRFARPEGPDESPVTVRTPSGSELDLLDPALAAELGGNVRAIKQDRGVFDTMPLSLIGTGTVAGLGELVGAQLDVQRFRPNLLIEPAGDEPFAEDGWIGCVLRIGGARVRVDKRDQRCVVVNVDPVTGRRDPSVLRAIGRARGACLGVYGQAVEPGRVEVGDPVLLESRG